MYSIGVDIGGTKCAVVLGETGVGDGAGDVAGASAGAGVGVTIIKKTVFGTLEPMGSIAKIRAGIDGLLKEYGIRAATLGGIGISCGGPLDAKRGLILSPPNLPGWDRVEIVRELSEVYGVPVYLDNDANACALAEWRYGAGRGCRDMVFLTFGTGLGAGLILNGALYRGACDMAGETGHIRLSEHGPVGYGKAGSFEGFCSGGGIAQLARVVAMEQLQMGKKPGYCPHIEGLAAISAKSVADCAYAGDKLAQHIYEVSGTYLGRGLSVLIDILNPERIVIGSIFKRCELLLRGAMERELERESLGISRRACDVVAADLGDNIGDYAALSLASQDHKSK